MKKPLFFMLSIIAVILLSACSAATPTGEGTLSTPSAEAPNTVPPPEAGKGTLTGLLIQRTEGSSEDTPYFDMRLYVGSLLKTEEGAEVAGKVDQMNSPQAFTDETGRFIFQNLDPGRYILVVQLPPNQLVMLKDPDSGKDMVVEIKADEITDLGSLHYYFSNPNLKN